MSEFRWFNRHEPQTLQIAQILLYLNAALALLSGALSLPILLGAVAAFGIANEKKWWGYWLGVVVSAYAVGRYIELLIEDVTLIKVITIPAIFAVALLVALLHEQSRSYRRIWFK